jgi:hypothetical protein
MLLKPERMAVMMRSKGSMLILFMAFVLVVSLVVANNYVSANRCLIRILSKNKGVSVMVDKDAALRIAHDDASENYRDLTIYEVQAVLEGGNWHIDYALKDPNLKGGAPHYVISASTGEIISRRYEQ